MVRAIAYNDFKTFVKLFHKTTDCLCKMCIEIKIRREEEKLEGRCGECSSCIQNRIKNCNCGLCLCEYCSVAGKNRECRCINCDFEKIIICEHEEEEKCDCPEIKDECKYSDDERDLLFEEEEKRIEEKNNRLLKLQNEYKPQIKCTEVVKGLSEYTDKPAWWEWWEIEYKHDPLCISAYYGRIKMMKYIIFMGGSDMIDMAFSAACSGQKKKAAKFLLEIGANPTRYGIVPIMNTINYNNILRFVLEHIHVSFEENSPIKYAISQNKIEALKIMIEEYKGDITCYDHKVIREASENCNIETLYYLLSKGGDFNKLNSINKRRVLAYKYFRKWRKLYFKRFIRKVILPLYYSSGFNGGENEKKKLELEFKNKKEI